MAERFSRTALARYVAGSSKPTTELASEIAAFLIENGKTSDLDSLMRDVMEIRGQEDGVVELTAESAYPLSQDLEDQIKSVAKKIYPNAREIVIHHELNKQVIGGVRLQFANASLDLTIESKLHTLREAIA